MPFAGCVVIFVCANRPARRWPGEVGLSFPEGAKSTQQAETGGYLFTDQQTYFLTFKSHTYTILVKSTSYRHQATRFLHHPSLQQ